MLVGAISSSDAVGAMFSTEEDVLLLALVEEVMAAWEISARSCVLLLCAGSSKTSTSDFLICEMCVVGSTAASKRQ